MKTFLTGTIFIAIIYFASGREISRDLAPRIVGGSAAPDGKYPYEVSLRVYFKHFCGGSILNHRWILTAANCIVNKRPDEISVIAGTNLLSEAGQLYQAILKITHPEFDISKNINDIGLIYVSRYIVYTNKIQPMSLPTSNFNKTEYPAVFTGWGRTSTTGDLSQRLQEINLLVISQETCVSLQDNVMDTHICTLTKIGEGACYGDSGGPLVADGQQIGILSFGNPCARGYPDVYTRVWSFLQWISKTIMDNDKAYLRIN